MLGAWPSCGLGTSFVIGTHLGLRHGVGIWDSFSCLKSCVCVMCVWVHMGVYCAVFIIFYDFRGQPTTHSSSTLSGEPTIPANLARIEIEVNSITICLETVPMWWALEKIFQEKWGEKKKNKDMITTDIVLMVIWLAFDTSLFNNGMGILPMGIFFCTRTIYLVREEDIKFVMTIIIIGLYC